MLEPLLSSDVYSYPLLTYSFVSLIMADANGPVCVQLSRATRSWIRRAGAE